ncbi:MAG: c-type cytochrome [Hyphomicrobiaceae bacterium]|nr:MAG: c-type cytochrome [Hyphomicrobiaceae bacterium]
MSLRGALTLALAAILATSAAADDAATLRGAGRLSDAAAAARGVSLDPLAPHWQAVPAVRLVAYPQTSIAAAADRSPPREVDVRVAVAGKTVAVRLEWPDETADGWDTDRTDAFPDAAAVQFAAQSDVLPYIGMGEPQQPVRLWLWRHQRRAEVLAARGFGSLEPARGSPPNAQAVRTGRGGWALVLRGERPFPANPLPMAVAVWDGAEQGRAGRKYLTAWHLVRLPGVKVDRAWLRRLAEEARSTGDAARGRHLVVDHGCNGCHDLQGTHTIDAGPDLSIAGGIHWPGYLRRSLLNPNAFIVPHVGYMQPGTDGRPVSLMPAFEGSSQDLGDLVAYLASRR